VQIVPPFFMEYIRALHLSCKLNINTGSKMKKLFFAATLFIAQYTEASVEKAVKSNVKSVTVFTQGAQVFRNSQVALSPGVTQLVFGGVSPFINPASVQAGGKGNFVVLEVKHNIRYPEPVAPKESTLPAAVLKEIKLLEDSIAEANFYAGDLAEKESALQLEKDMILKNKLTKGEGKSDSLAVLIKAMEFFRIKLTDINTQLGKIKRDEKRNNELLARANARINDLRTYKTKEEPEKKYEPVHEVIVTVSADEAATAAVEVSYMVTGAGWVPSYDLRSTTITAPVQLTYKANVYQTSGENWKDVKLKLSTGNPNRSNIKPVLPPWYINYYTQQPAYLKGTREKSLLNTIAGNEQMDAAKKDMDELAPAQSAANYSQLIETMTNVEFDIALAYDIPSDGKNHIVSVKTSELPSTYCHYLVPKIESEAFLLARVTGWENLNLLPGRANVFYEGTYVGETVLNPTVINDTLELALGRDNGITITRTKLPVKENNKLLGNEITKTVAYELRLKNNKSRKIELVVEDQIPLSNNKEIKVEMKDHNKAEYNEQTGLLKWTMAVNSKEYKTLKFSYAVTYNKDMPLSLY
jgi:uncharacterized protein (TIGR02231 family)